MAATFHTVPTGARGLACDLCGCLVDPSDEGRAVHQRSHPEPVVDLTGAHDVEQARPAT